MRSQLRTPTPAFYAVDLALYCSSYLPLSLSLYTHACICLLLKQASQKLPTTPQLPGFAKHTGSISYSHTCPSHRYTYCRTSTRVIHDHTQRFVHLINPPMLTFHTTRFATRHFSSLTSPSLPAHSHTHGTIVDATSCSCSCSCYCHCYPASSHGCFLTLSFLFLPRFFCCVLPYNPSLSAACYPPTTPSMLVITLPYPYPLVIPILYTPSAAPTTSPTPPSPSPTP